MTQCSRPLRKAAVIVLVMLFNAPFSVQNAHGRDESYRPGGVSPSPSSSRSPGHSSSASPRSVPKDYDDDYSVNSWSAVLAVSASGSVEVTEAYDVNTTRRQRGILRHMDDLYNSLLIYDVTCAQGYAAHADSESSGQQFTFGYYDEKAPGRHLFTLKYRAAGMVVPAGTGARLQWRWNAEKNLKIDSVKVVFPAGATFLGARAIETATRSRFVRFEKELQSVVAGNTITIPVNRNFQNTLDITADLPAGVIDQKTMREYLDQITEKKQFPSLLEYRTAVTIHDDRTIDREEVYRTAPDNVINSMTMWYDRRFDTAFWNDKKKSDTPEFVHNTLYLYGFDKMPCENGNVADGSVCIPLAQAGTERAALRYSMWGNFNPNDPMFFDLRFPPADAKRTDRVRFSITVPPFVKKEQVRVALYLVRGFTRGSQLHETSYAGRWEGNRLVGEYPASLYDEQYVLARVFIPAAGFRDPGIAKRAGIYLSYSWHFYRSWCIVALALIVLLLAAVPALIWLIRMKKTSVIAAASVSVKTTIDDRAVSAVRAEDPAFSPEAFLEKARIIAGKIQAAWSNGNMAPVRNLVSQGVYNRFRLQLRLMREQEKVENLMDAFTVRSISLIKASLSHSYHTLHVHVNASALDVVVPVSMTGEEKKRALDRAKKSYFTEVYSFTRKRGAVTDPARNLLAGQCPSCGTVPESFGDSNRCKNCGTIYNSGEFDWVLSEITQGGEWRAGSSEEVPGLAALETESLSMNRGVIEDRASCLFWQWVAGQATGSAAPLARDATEKFLGQFKPGAGYFAETAVGSVDLQEVTKTDGAARAVVLVLWSAALAQGKVPEHREHRLTLVLPPLMKNPYGFADHSCDSCGAPLPESDAQTCSYCGSALQKTNSDWLLDGIEEKK